MSSTKKCYGPSVTPTAATGYPTDETLPYKFMEYAGKKTGGGGEQDKFEGDIANAKAFCDSNTDCIGVLSGGTNGRHFPTGGALTSTPPPNVINFGTFSPVIPCPGAPAAASSSKTAAAAAAPAAAPLVGGQQGAVVPASTTSTTSTSSGPAPVDATSTNYMAGFNAGQSAASASAAAAAASAAKTAGSPGVVLAQDTRTGLIVTGVVTGIIVLFLAYYYLFRQSGVMLPFTSRITSFITYSIIVSLITFGSFFIYEGVAGDKASSGNLAKKPIDSSTSATIPAASTPAQAGVNGGNYGIQWWMYIKDWDTKFGQEKTVITRGSTGSLNPYIYLHPTDNSLEVKIDYHQTTGSSAAASGDVFTCELKNVPLQTWFAVGVSVSGRNVDIYRDGKLLRSCLLPGVPMTPTGDLGIMSNGGFSGNVIDVFSYARALTPSDAQNFFNAGTGGTSYTPNSLPSRPFFGYSVNVGVTDRAGNVTKLF